MVKPIDFTVKLTLPIRARYVIAGEISTMVKPRFNAPLWTADRWSQHPQMVAICITRKADAVLLKNVVSSPILLNIGCLSNTKKSLVNH